MSRTALNDANQAWRIILRIDSDAIVILAVFSKKTQKTPVSTIKACQERLKNYDSD